MTEPTTFEEFWPYYVSEHRDPANRALHYVGTTLVIGTVATAAITMNPAWLLAAPVVGYGPAWIGHFFIEKNRPASFKYPLWSLAADFKMYGLALRGKMAEEVERICADAEARVEEEGDAHEPTNGKAHVEHARP
jgi:hypothetical protein